MPRIGTIVLILGAAAAALFAWAFWKSKQSGSTGGVWGIIDGLWSGASNLTTDVTGKSVATASTLGSGVASGVRGGSSLVTDVLKTGGRANPLNW
jgi:hypothetical protein